MAEHWYYDDPDRDFLRTRCGTIKERWVKMEYKPGKWKMVCPNCHGIAKRRCLKCGKLFKPGCKVRYTCLSCHSSNKSSTE